MERNKGTAVKTFCYKSKNECDIVESGIILLTFLVCRNCGMEVSQNLKELKEKPEEKADESEFWKNYGDDAI